MKGAIQATINGERYNIVENDLITLPPNYFMEIHEFSSDIHIYYAGFSSQFIENINLIAFISVQYISKQESIRLL